MESKREQVWVGLFVIVAATLLIVTVFVLTGAFAGSAKTFRARFHNVAGLEPGATVRYAGGPKIGRVEKVEIDPNDPALMDMQFSVKSNLPIKTDSHVAILSFSPLGDNHLEIKAGSPGAPQAASGSFLPSDPYVGFNDLTAQINQLAPQAKELLTNLNERVVQLKITVDRINDLLNDRNRENVSASLAELHGMLAENRPEIRSTLKNVNAASANFTKGLARLGMRDGVHVNAIHPGLTATDRVEQLIEQRAAAAGKSSDAMRAEMLEKSGTNRMATVEDIAALAVFLCTERARHIQGTAIAVDGGATPGVY
jgi:ABC-type transporter Mla subunit MlaD